MVISRGDGDGDGFGVDGGWAADAESFDFALHGLAGDAEEFGGLGLVLAGPFERFDDEDFFGEIDKAAGIGAALDGVEMAPGGIAELGFDVAG